MKNLMDKQNWFTDYDEHTALSIQIKGGKPLYQKQSPFQLVEVYDTAGFGKMLVIDHFVMTTELDEVGYHEMIAHVPLMAGGDEMKRVLIIGGGDGGTAREVLKHEHLERVVMVEIDELVVKACQEHMPTLACALNDPNLELIIGDGIAYVKEAADESFDLIIVDSTDPFGPAEGLFSYDFYRHAYRALSPNGILVTQSESPRCNIKAFKDCYACYRSIFGQDQVFCYLTNIATYPSGLWSFSFSSKGNIHPYNQLDVNKAKAFTAKQELAYYNEDIHKAAFALPNFARQLLMEEKG